MKKRLTGTFFLMLLVFLINNSAFSQVTVSDGDDLQDAVNSAMPGDVIIVLNGTYNDFESTFEINGTAEEPVYIKAESIGGVTLTGESNFVFKKSSHAIIEGFVFDAEGDDTLIKLEGSNNIRITRNVFELKTTESVKWVYIGGFWNDYTFEYASHNNRIDHNIFQNKTTPGHYITVDGTGNEDESDIRQSQYDRIDHNYFRNNSPRAENEQESIRIGWSEMSMSSGFTIVENNLFEDCDGDPEIISVKSSDNIIRHNTFLKSYGTLSLRHGNRNWVEGNFFFGGDKENGTTESSTTYTGGIRIYGTDHVIINNYMEGFKGTIWDAPIALTQGDAIDGNSSSLSKHFRAERVTIAYNTLVNNTYGIEIGFDNNGDYGTQIKDILIANNIVTGSENTLVNFIDGNDQNGEVEWINNVFFPSGEAETLSGREDFTTSEALIENPNLSLNEGLWRTTENSPSLESGATSINNSRDMDGQFRPDPSMVGADHFSADSIRFKPLTPEDVGPNAYEENDESTFLSLSSISEFEAGLDTQYVTINSNLDWTIENNADWISINPISGSGNSTIELSVNENPSQNVRESTITVVGGSLQRGITVTQSGAQSQNGAVKLSVVEVTASSEQAPNNVKENTVDADLSTRWSAQGVGETITFDLGEVYELELVKIAVFKGTERLTYFDVASSVNGTEFEVLLADQTNSQTTDDLENYVFEADARYVQLIGGGNSGTEFSDWTSITEVEIYGKELTTTPNEIETQLPASFLLIGNYPNPFNPSTNIQFQLAESAQYTISVFSVQGQLMMEEIGFASVGISTSVIDMKTYPTGVYFYKVTASVNGQDHLVGTGKMTLIK